MRVYSLSGNKIIEVMGCELGAFRQEQSKIFKRACNASDQTRAPEPNKKIYEKI